jgi:hypothetical protein
MCTEGTTQCASARFVRLVVLSVPVRPSLHVAIWIWMGWTHAHAYIDSCVPAGGHSCGDAEELTDVPLLRLYMPKPGRADVQPMARHALARFRSSPARRPLCPYRPGPVRVSCLGKRLARGGGMGSTWLSARTTSARSKTTPSHATTRGRSFLLISEPCSPLSRSRATRLGDFCAAARR